MIVNSDVNFVVDDYNNPVADLVDFVSFFFSCLCSRLKKYTAPPIKLIRLELD